MTTIDLRPWAVAILATLYAVVFWVFQARVPPAATTGTVRYELAPGARPDVRLPPTRVAPARVHRVLRTRSS